MTLPPSLFFDLEDFFMKKVFAKCMQAWHIFLLLPEFFEKYSYQGLQGEVHPSAFLENENQIELGKGSIIEPGAYVKGPCIIGQGSIIRHGAYIRGFVVIGNDCIVGHGTEIKNSILLHRAKAAHFAYIGNSLIGNDVNLGAGVKCANVRLDKEKIKVSIEGNSVSTELKKLGVIIGDESFLGCNVVTNPGTFLLPRTRVLPGKIISGYSLKSHAVN